MLVSNVVSKCKYNFKCFNNILIEEKTVSIAENQQVYTVLSAVNAFDPVTGLGAVNRMSSGKWI